LEIIMARTQPTTVETSNADQLNAIIEALRNRQPIATQRSFISDTIVDKTANSGGFVGRMKAAVESARDTYNDGYELERERQLRLRAERILKATQR
jgi:hypothetical protein